MGLLKFSIAESRQWERTTVHCRLDATDQEGKAVPLVIVDLSAQGLMARTTATVAEGAVLQLPLPVVGTYRGEVRWARAGRIGCELDRAIGLSDYRALLGAISHAH